KQKIEKVANAKGGILADSPSVEKVKSALNNRGMKAAVMASNAGCMVLKAVGAVNVAVGAVQTANVIQYASKYLELADKIKAGQADEAVNIAMNNLNTRMSTTIKMDGEEHDIDGSVTESAGWGQVFSSTNIINENDPSAMYANRELVGKVGLKQALGDGVLRDVIGGAMNIGDGIKAFRLCNGLQIFGAIIDGLSDVASLLTLGVAGLVKEFIEGAVKGLALSAAVLTIGTVINLVTPVVANWFAGMLTEAFLGKNGGFALLSGAQNIMNSNLQMSTGRYADNENAKEVFASTQDVEREWAAYERATRSPFDITSKYTFLGSMYNSALPLIHSSRSSVMGTISSVANLALNSVASIVSPSVSAADETNKFANSLATEGNCAFLQSAGVAGDFACNKYAGAYVGELTTESPGDIYERMKNYESFEMDNNEVVLDNDGNPKIDSSSEYAKYIVACVVSDNQPGTVSASVQGFISKVSNPSESFVVNGLINVGKSILPFIDSGTDLFEGFEEKENLQWNAGLACTGNTDNPELNQRIKDYSMYNLDQRVLYDMGVIENNSTVSFLEDYYKENPLDHSFEGTIARFSGMSKEQVEDTLALIDYYQFLNEYDASDRFAFGEPAVKAEKELKFDNDNKLANNYFLLLNQISFADVRNRNFAV
ncbi:hypothetical protein IKZ77_01975, partial [Candidatus Saccharibacteria bacterium]|nr:hypothetical protein [Candidatus Saccharibacteria bacterium]